MFRSNQYCSRYEETPIQLDTAITIPGNNGIQKKEGYKFTINDRSSYFDWFNGFFEVKFVVNQLDGGVVMMEQLLALLLMELLLEKDN